MKKIISFLFSFLLAVNFSSAYTCPNYMFSTDLKKGDTNADVKVIQEILNLDKRTMVAQVGPGSQGHETAYFGVATRESLKRFQALFIEYVGIANGKFGPRTRTTMNAVCKGPFFTKGTGNVFDTAAGTSSKDKIPPVVAVAGPNTASSSEPFRAFLGANEPLQTPELSGLIISNATAGDLRKVSPTTFSFLVTPNADATGNITLQFEAESLSDLAGNKNQEATNEWVVLLNGVSSDTTIDLPTIDLPIVTPSTDCSTVSSVDVSDYNNPCYGKAPMSNASQNPQSDSGSGGGGGDMLQQLLQGLMQGLSKVLGGGGQDAGGTGTPSGTCMCPPLMGQPTGILAGLKGPSGGTLLTPCPGAGHYVGKAFPPPPVCGQAFIKGKCINPQADSNGVPLTSTVGACGPTWQWSF